MLTKAILTIWQQCDAATICRYQRMDGKFIDGPHQLHAQIDFRYFNALIIVMTLSYVTQQPPGCQLSGFDLVRPHL